MSFQTPPVHFCSKRPRVPLLEDPSSYAERPFAFVGSFIRRHALAHAVILIAVLGAVGCSVGMQYGLKLLVDVLSHGPNAAGVWPTFILLVGLIAGDNLLWRVAGIVASRAFIAVTGELRGVLFRHLTGHAPAYFADHPQGALASRVSTAANAVYAAESLLAWNVLPPFVATVSSIAFLGTISPAMAASTAGAAAVIAAVLYRMAANGTPLHRAYAAEAAAVDGEMVDVIGNISLVRAFAGTRREHARLDRRIGRETEAWRRSLRYLEFLRLGHALITILLTLVALGWAIRLWQHGGASNGDVVLVASLAFTILHASRDLAVALVEMTHHLAKLAEALTTVLAPHGLHDHPEAVPLRVERGAVALEKVTFAYPERPAIFEHFDLRVMAGRRVGFVGESGGGKSTLFALLQRAYDPQSGRITVDGQDIARVTQESLGQALAVVPQDISLLHRSIRENIRYGRPDASDRDVEAAVEAAHCRDFVEALPAGLETVVGDRGLKLSGGQRQRIAIARALLKDAPILLLDEATAALDGESEEAVRSALERLMRGRTVLAIAHRLSTLRGFDRIVVLHDGRIVQDGPPDELMQRPGPYRELVEREAARLARDAA